MEELKEEMNKLKEISEHHYEIAVSDIDKEMQYSKYHLNNIKDFILQVNDEFSCISLKEIQNPYRCKGYTDVGFIKLYFYANIDYVDCIVIQPTIQKDKYLVTIKYDTSYAIQPISKEDEKVEYDTLELYYFMLCLENSKKLYNINIKGKKETILNYDTKESRK